MGIQMATSGLAASAGSVMPPDCPMHAQAGANDADHPASLAFSGADGCSCCDLCIPMARLADASLLAVRFAAHAQPLTRSVDFVSAPPAAVLKPPIS